VVGGGVFIGARLGGEGVEGGEKEWKGRVEG